MNSQVQKIDKLIKALEAQLIIAQALKTKELDLCGITDELHRQDVKTEMVYIHRLLGAGDAVTHELIDMLMVD